MMSPPAAIGIYFRKYASFRGRSTHAEFWLLVLFLAVAEFALGMLGLMLFPHIDTPVCAGANPYCFPDGHAGLTNAAILLFVVNLMLVVPTLSLIVRYARGLIEKRSIG